ncbi:MAG: hypothetical protein IIC60_15055, partial [Proteobacteria bacterium]|nr:hypothetical protein [Pseudomonadota bacterium]
SNQIIQSAQQQLRWIIKQLKHPDRRLQEHAQNLDRLESRMQRAIVNRIGLQKSELMQLSRSLHASSPVQKLQQSKMQFENGMKRLKQSLQSSIKAKRARLVELTRSLSAISPLDTLARGYSITYDDSAQVIRSSVDVKVGSKISSRLDKGRITSTVEAVYADE